MHQRIDRKALALQLLGTAEEPGPLDAGWVKRRFAISGTALMNWRKRGIPRDRLDDVLEAMNGLLSADTTKDASPEWARRLARDLEKQIQANREAIVAALAPRVTRRFLEDNEPLLRQIRDVLARVERRLEE